MSTHERSEMEWTTFEVSSLILYAAHVPTKCSQYKFTKKDKKGKLRIMMRTINVNVRPRRKKDPWDKSFFFALPIRKVVVFDNKSSKERMFVKCWSRFP